MPASSRAPTSSPGPSPPTAPRATSRWSGARARAGAKSSSCWPRRSSGWRRSGPRGRVAARSPEADGDAEQGAAALGPDLASDTLGKLDGLGLVGIELYFDLVVQTAQLFGSGAGEVGEPRRRYPAGTRWLMIPLKLRRRSGQQVVLDRVAAGSRWGCRRRRVPVDGPGDLLGRGRAVVRRVLRAGPARHQAEPEEDHGDQDLAGSDPHLGLPTHRQGNRPMPHEEVTTGAPRSSILDDGG